MNTISRTLKVGIAQWCGAGIALISAYMLKIGTFESWDWFVVLTGFAAHAAAGLTALATYFKNTPVQEKRPAGKKVPVQAVLADDIDLFDVEQMRRVPDRSAGRVYVDRRPDPATQPDPVPPVVRKSGRVMASENFSQAELECKGVSCNCKYPGMTTLLMHLVEDLRMEFGPLIVNSAYRCAVHNKAVGGAPDSYHMKGRALDIRPARSSVTPEQIYEYLTSKYPRRYGFGLYNTMCHVDDRTGGVWARKAGPDEPWQEFRHQADIELD